MQGDFSMIQNGSIIKSDNNNVVGMIQGGKANFFNRKEEMNRKKSP